MTEPGLVRVTRGILAGRVVRLGDGVDYEPDALEPVGQIRAGDRVRLGSMGYEGVSVLSDYHEFRGRVFEVAEIETTSPTTDGPLVTLAGSTFGRVFARRLALVAWDEPLGLGVKPPLKITAREAMRAVLEHERSLSALREERDVARENVNELARVVAGFSAPPADRIGCSLANTRGQQALDAERDRDSWKALAEGYLAKLNPLRDELALEREHVLRLKLALAEAAPSGPPPSSLERAFRRVAVEARWLRSWACAAPGRVADRLPLWSGGALATASLALVLGVRGCGAVSCQDQAAKPDGSIKLRVADPAPVGSLTLLGTTGTVNIMTFTRGGATSFSTGCDARGRGEVSVSFPGAHGAERCWHCGHSLESFARSQTWGGEVRVAQDGGTLLDGCLWCLAERLRAR